MEKDGKYCRYCYGHHAEETLETCRCGYRGCAAAIKKHALKCKVAKKEQVSGYAIDPDGRH